MRELIDRQTAIKMAKTYGAEEYDRGYENGKKAAQPGWIPWDKNTRNSMKYTLQTLYRLAYNIHGVMDAIDDDNVKRLIALLEGGQDESND